MKPFLFCSLLMFFVVSMVSAQPTAIAGSVEYQKGFKSGALIELPYSPAVVEKALKDYFIKNGVKEDKTKGFQTYKGIRLAPTDAEVVDGYFKVDKKSRKENNVSRVYMLVGRPNENVALRTEADAYMVDEAKTFLNDLVPSIEAYNLEVDIANQDDLVKKAEKKMKNLQDDQVSMEKKIRDLEEKLGQNKRDQEMQLAELSKQRSARDAMQSRRK